MGVLQYYTFHQNCSLSLMILMLLMLGFWRGYFLLSVHSCSDWEKDTWTWPYFPLEQSSLESVTEVNYGLVSSHALITLNQTSLTWLEVVAKLMTSILSTSLLWNCFALSNYAFLDLYEKGSFDSLSKSLHAMRDESWEIESMCAVLKELRRIEPGPFLVEKYKNTERNQTNMKVPIVGGFEEGSRIVNLFSATSHSIPVYPISSP